MLARAGVALFAAVTVWSFEPGSEASRLESRDVPGLETNSSERELEDSTSFASELAADSAPVRPYPNPSPPDLPASLSARPIRVALDEAKSIVACELRGRWKDSVGRKWTGKISVRLDSRGIVLVGSAGKRSLGAGATFHSPEGSFCYGPKCFRGDIRFERMANGIAVINLLPLEDYLLGVVPGEIGRRLDPRFMEAIKAQAIVARTYALRSLNQYSGKPWDVRDDVRDQVYDGLKGEDTLCSIGVRSTSGRILVDSQGKAIDAFYHSTSGGHTADIQDVWPNKSVQSYLRGVADTASDGRAWGGAALVAQWVEHWPVERLHESVRNDLSEAIGRKVDPGEVKSLRLEGRDPSGRARKLVVEAENGSYEVGGDRIRWALRRPAKGRPILRSSRFELVAVDGEYVAEGTGYGHGVGMSQNGAMGRAFAGQSCNQILSAYYPGTVLRTLEP